MANEQLLELYRSDRKIFIEKFLKQLNSPLLFKLFLAGRLPMGFIAGLGIKYTDKEKCEVIVPYRWLNQNPFRSTYFAVLSMAAEMSTGVFSMLATHQSNPSVSTLVTHLDAEFVKKATGVTTFTCTQGKEIFDSAEQAVLTGEPKLFTATTVGTSESGEVEARFKVEWSFKLRSRK